jgi:hypothetical protein
VTPRFKALSVLRDLYRSEWPGQGNFGPKHTVVLRAWHERGALAIGGAPGAPHFAFHHRPAYRSRELTMFTNGDAPFARRRRGDLVVDAMLIRRPEAIGRVASRIEALGRDRPLWLELLPEDVRQTRVAQQLGAVRLGTRFTSESGVLAIWFRRSPAGDDAPIPRTIPVSDIQHLAAVRLAVRVSSKMMTALRDECRAVATDRAMARHYSKKNKGRRWGALSLYGFSADPKEIAKPSEVSDRKNPPIRATKLLRQRPRLKRLVDAVIQQVSMRLVTERVRLMRLAAAEDDKSEVERHSDLTDREHGLDDGQLVRLHLPILTNPGATVGIWDEDNREARVHLRAGAWYYLDVRRPHRVLNAGTSDRLHLVVDCRASSALRRVIGAGGRLASGRGATA